jgi:hypothetical protein
VFIAAFLSDEANNGSEMEFAPADEQNVWSAIARIQRNFYP